MTDGAEAAGEAVIFETDGHVARITLNRPHAMNALDTAARERLLQAMARVHDDPEIRVGILTGAGGRAFSAGADLKEWAQPD